MRLSALFGPLRWVPAEYLKILSPLGRELMLCRIAILVHQYDTFEETAYFVREFAKIWRERGIEVAVLRDPGERVDADLAILHVDLTVVPPVYLAMARRYPLCVNGRVADISKRFVSTATLSLGADHEGPVMVKSNLNSNGAKEFELARRTGHALPPAEYAVYASAADVPSEVWTDRNLTVERFCAERKDGLYAMRTWMFFGQRETGSIAYSPNPVIKSGRVVHKESLNDIPNELRQLREAYAFDFGTFNYSVCDGEVVLFDANRTPTLGQDYDGIPTENVFYFAEEIFSLRQTTEGFRSDGLIDASIDQNR